MGYCVAMPRALCERVQSFVLQRWVNKRVLQSLYTLSSDISRLSSLWAVTCVWSGDCINYHHDVLSKMAPNHLKIGYFFFASGGWGAAAPQTPRSRAPHLTPSSPSLPYYWLPSRDRRSLDLEHPLSGLCLGPVTVFWCGLAYRPVYVMLCYVMCVSITPHIHVTAESCRV